MPIQTHDYLINEIQTTLADNVIGKITPSLHRQLETDIIDTMFSTQASSVWNNIRKAKTSSYTVATTDIGVTFALSTGGQTLTFGLANTYPTNFITTIVNEDTARAWFIVVPGQVSFFLYPNQVAIIFQQGTAWRILKNNRWKLQNNLTLYVSTTGNDANDGLDVSAPFATIQKAYNTIAFYIDLSGFAATIQLADGTYTAGLNTIAPPINEGLVILQGNASTPSNTVISITNNNAILVSGAGITVEVLNLKITTSGFGDCIVVGSNAVCNWGNIIFDACASQHVECFNYGQANCIGNYSITGSAVSHLHCYQFGFINVGAFTVTITGTPAFSGFFAGVAGAQIAIVGTTFSGSATGARYLAHDLGWIYTNGGGSTYLPGNSGGTADGTTFGIYS